MLQTLYFILAVLSTIILTLSNVKRETVNPGITTFGGAALIVSWIICMYVYGILILLLTVALQITLFKIISNMLIKRPGN
jgi:hypothetical protein